MPQCRICDAPFPNHVWIDGKLRNLSNRKFCLSCSPFGRHNTRNSEAMQMPAGMRRCPQCRQVLLLDQFYRRRNNKHASVYCRACTNTVTIARQQKLKRLAVAYKGGKCQNCGYDRYIGSLEFHHMDPEAKDFDVANCKLTSFNRVRPELDKCVLLCANCHREEHARLKCIFTLPPLFLSPAPAAVLNTA